MRSRDLLFALACIALALGSCKDKPHPDGVTPTPLASQSGMPVVTDVPKGDIAHGKALVTEYECNRCHLGTETGAPTQDKDCVGCHLNVVDGKLKSTPETTARWITRVKDLTYAPTLDVEGARVRRSWIEGYLALPVHVRPKLAESMPRLDINAANARDMAAYLTRDDSSDDHDEPLPQGDAGHGRQLLETKGCGTCHTFSRTTALAVSPVTVTLSPRDMQRALVLAPDLVFSRERMTPSKMAAWLADPQAVKPGSAMPKIPLAKDEIRDIVAYAFGAELMSSPKTPVFVRLPVLARRVTYDEVDAKVFHRTCWHCHSEPDFAIGDGGPGNSGGFGFKPRGLNLSSYEGVAAGFLDAKGERQSVFAKGADGAPRLVEALVARHVEEGDAPTGDVRGMPLGYASLSAEDIQLVETWVAEGRPRS